MAEIVGFGRGHTKCKCFLSKIVGAASSLRLRPVAGCELSMPKTVNWRFDVMRLIFTVIQVPLVAAIVLSAAHGAGPDLAPAQYKPLPVGTVLEYKTWQCRLEAGAPNEQVCRGVAGDRVTFYRHFVPVGHLPKSGYATGLTGIWCAGHNAGGAEIEEPFEDVILDQKARTAIDSLWPLQVGKEVLFRRNFRPVSGSAKSKIRVAGTRTVTVGGAERQVYVLKGETRKLNCSTGAKRGFDEEWWYDPALGAVVHYEIAWGTTQTSEFLNFNYDLVKATVPAAPPLMAAATPAVPARGIRARGRAPGADLNAPSIETAPKLETSSASVEIAGRVRDQSRVVEVTIDGRAVAVAADGSFSARRGVSQGHSVLRVAAVDEWGNQATRTIAITRRAAAAARASAPAQANKTPDPFADVHFGNYHALVIGNNDYRHIPGLKMAAGDARAVAAVLKADYGFDVSLVTNATRADVIGALAKLRARLTANDNLLVYYAGHGLVDELAQVGYWLPVDAEEGIPTNWVSTGDVTAMLRAIRAKHVMVVADSCYSGTLVRAVKPGIKTSVDRVVWVKRMVGQRSRTALVSGGLEPVMDGGGRGHSVFARAFLNALRDNGGVMEGEALFDTLKRSVAVNSDQTPQYSDIRKSGHEGGDFLFVRRGS